jgi:hypothetical protein
VWLSVWQGNLFDGVQSATYRIGRAKVFDADTAWYGERVANVHMGSSDSCFRLGVGCDLHHKVPTTENDRLVVKVKKVSRHVQDGGLLPLHTYS